MKPISIKLFLILFLLTCNFAQAQSREQQRELEHRAVKELLMKAAAKRGIAHINSKYSKHDFSGVLPKQTAQSDRKFYFMNGNKISTNVYNYGGIAPGYGLLRGINNVVWNNVDYVFQFCPIVGAAVPNANGGNSRIHIISDGLWDYPSLREVSPTGDTLWQWQPLPGYADPEQEFMASNPADDTDGDGKPDSWPREWYNPTLGKYVWPGFLSQDATNADLEVYWAMDDRDNTEFPYYPFVGDSSRKGIGVQVDGRAFQWSNALAEDAIFFVYSITNTSNKDLDSVFFGIYGDPDIGGSSPENTDDFGFFVPPYSNDSVNVDNIPVYARSLVYFWDPDMTGKGGLPIGYLACKYLESPGDAENGIDDDGDGMIDERQDDGIDNDGDWNPDIDDVGVDGIPGTDDEGEGDGIPTAGKRLPDGSPNSLFPGEPNFEFTDLDEADQIGLTSFNSWTWNSDKISNDESMWNRCIPRNFGDIQQAADIVFIFASGYISLKAGETKRISMALLLGEDLDDMLLTAETVQRIYNQNYQFFKPPAVPTVTAVPGDKKVTLYWDKVAEESDDPITGKDFEGYVIYRSTDPSFNDLQNITDGKGSGFLNEPLKDVNGFEAKWDIDIIDEPYVDKNSNGRYDTGEPFTDINNDLKWSANIEDPWKGYHPVPYQGRGIHYYLGNNSGLVHSFVDSNKVINGQTYYYAVVAYDHGDSVGIPPTETTKKISVDPITSKLKFDKNTVQVIPGPRAGGYISPVLTNQNIIHSSGIGTGNIEFNLLNDLEITEGSQYLLEFSDSLTINNNRVPIKNYSVLKLDPVSESFTTFDTNFTKLGHLNVSDDEFLKVTGGDGKVYLQNADYVLNFTRGSIRRTGTSSMEPNGTFNISYRYFPIAESQAWGDVDNNPVFEGIKVLVYDEESLTFDDENSGWAEGNSNLELNVGIAGVGGTRQKYPADYEIKFSSSFIDTALTTFQLVKVPVKYTVNEVTNGVPQRILTFLNESIPSTRDSSWDPGEEIVLFKPGSKGLPTDTVNWGVILTIPSDTTVEALVPTDGDVLIVRTKRPFSKQDTYTLTTVSAKVDNQLASSQMDNIYVVPNPYVGYSEIEPANKLPGDSRGERRIYFEHLPRQCTIRIYSISGNLVRELRHDSGVDNAREYWNLLNRDGFSVAYGVYIAHVDAPGVGEKILKFALIK